ncbi:MAG: hypothetical protein P8J27_14245 [Mariniblastus sp.]|nr:hypothetical protein [Mariniblastus sp.]
MTNDSPIQPNSNDELTNPIEIPNLEPQNQLESRIRPTNTTPSNSPDSDQLPERFQPRSTHRETVDAKLVNQTKNQIRLLVQEIADLAKSDCSVEEFYEGFLTRTTNALASTGGAIWVRDSIDEPLKLHYHINLKQTNLATDKKAQSQHSRLLCKLAEQGEPTLVSPASGSADEMSGNPTDSLLVVGPLKIDNATLGLVEIFQRPGAGPTTQRGYLRFLMQMCDIASDFLCNRRIRSFAQQQMMWQQLEHFMRLIHQGLDTDQTVFTLANEGRRLIDCDRCSVAIGYGRNCLIKAVSGLDSIERRAEQVKKLSSLSASVVRTGQPLWYTGEDDELPPQLEKKMHAYVDKSHTKMLAIIPLFESDKDSEDTAPASPRDREKRKPMGALVVEQLKDSRITPGLKKRTEIVVQHGQTALTNATEHNRIFLMPVWKGLGKLTRAFDTGNRLKSATIIGFLVGISAFLCLFPYSFGLGANGSLTPQTQREIFSQTSGTMIEVNVSDSGDTVVETGSVLAVLKNTDIELEISKLIGEIAIYDQDVKSYTRLQGGTGRERLSSLELHEVNSKARQAEQAIESLKNELQIRQH